MPGERIQQRSFNLEAMKNPVSPSLIRVLYPRAELLGSTPNAVSTENANIIGANVTLVAGGYGSQMGA